MDNQSAKNHAKTDLQIKIWANYINKIIFGGKMNKEIKNDSPITRTVKVLYEVNGQQYEAIPVSDEEAEAAGLKSVSCTGTPPCDGHYICIGGNRWRCMLNHEYKRCQYYRTNEVC